MNLPPGTNHATEWDQNLPACPVPLTISVYLLSVWKAYLRPDWISSMMCCGEQEGVFDAMVYQKMLRGRGEGTEMLK